MARTAKATKPITAAQIKRIHTIVHILGISDDNYRECLDDRFEVTSCKDLTIQQAHSFIDELEKYALGNTLYRRLTQDYRGFTDYGVSRLVGNNIRNATDFRPLESVRIGYYGDLPTIDSDTDDYPDLGEVYTSC